MAETIVSKYDPATAAVRIAGFLFIVFLISSIAKMTTDIDMLIIVAVIFAVSLYFLKYFSIKTSIMVNPEFVKINYLLGKPWFIRYDEIDNINSYRHTSGRSGSFQYQQITLKDGRVLSFSEQDFTNYSILKITIFQNMLESLEQNKESLNG